MKISLLVLIFLRFTTADELTEAVENYSYQSIAELTGIEHVVKCNGNYTIRSSKLRTINRIMGVFSNMTFHGLENVQNITTYVETIMQSKPALLEYNVMIPSLVLRGNYNLSGTFTSKIFIKGEGKFEIKLAAPVELYCRLFMGFYLGYVTVGECDNIGAINYTMKGAQMLFSALKLQAKQTELDPKLKDVIIEQTLSKTFILDELSHFITEIINEKLRGSFQKHKLIDIVTSKSATATQQRRLITRHEPFSHLYEETEIDRRFGKFIAKTMADLSQKGKQPIAVNHSIKFLGSLLFPAFGELSNIKLTGLGSMHNLQVRVRDESLESIEFDLHNLGILGHYNITGSIAGEEIRNWENEFNITALVKLHFRVDIRNPNHGGLKYDSFDRHFGTQSKEPEEWNAASFNISFTNLYTGMGLTKKLQAKATESVGLNLLSMKNRDNLFTEPFRQLIFKQMRQFSKNVSILDIINMK